MARSAAEQGNKADLLPGIISKIEVQKKNAARYSIYVSDSFLIGVSETVLVQFGLKKGFKLTPSQFRDVEEAEYREKIRYYLIDLLSRRDHASRELLLKGLKKGYPKIILQQLISDLELKGYINNEEFAEKFAREKAEKKHWGPLKIRSELGSRGISQKTADLVIDKIFDSINSREAILELISKRLSTYQRAESAKRKDKIYRYLSSRGYRSNEIMNALPDIMKLFDTD